jgi:hypothetical protein
VANKPDHIHSKCRTRSQEGQQMELQQTDQITYKLRMKQGHKKVSRSNCSKQTGSHTS